jgi:hypothetical protein
MFIYILALLALIPGMSIFSTDHTVTAINSQNVNRSNYPFIRYPYLPDRTGQLQQAGKISKSTTLLYLHREHATFEPIRPEDESTEVHFVSPKKLISLKRDYQILNQLFRLAEINGELFLMSVQRRTYYEITPNGSVQFVPILPTGERRYFNNISIFKRINKIARACFKIITAGNECTLYINGRPCRITQTHDQLYLTTVASRRRVAPEPLPLVYALLSLWHTHAEIRSKKAHINLFVKPSCCCIS